MRHFFVVGTLLLLVVLCQALPQKQSVKKTLVIDSLPAPKDEEIRKIRTPDKWQNPYVIISADGYELILADKKRSNRNLTLDELETTLLDLPLERWPLGKVIAVQEAGLRSPGDDLQISSNLRALEHLLEAYKISINDLWPSG